MSLVRGTASEADHLHPSDLAVSVLGAGRRERSAEIVH
jgi:hypothetical protein